MDEQLKSPRSILRLKALKQVKFQQQYEKSEDCMKSPLILLNVYGTKSP